MGEILLFGSIAAGVIIALLVSKAEGANSVELDLQEGNGTKLTPTEPQPPTVDDIELIAAQMMVKNILANPKHSQSLGYRSRHRVSYDCYPMGYRYHKGNEEVDLYVGTAGGGDAIYDGTMTVGTRKIAITNRIGQPLLEAIKASLQYQEDQRTIAKNLTRVETASQIIADLSSNTAAEPDIERPIL